MKDAPVDGGRADGSVGQTELIVWNGAVTRVRPIGGLLPPKKRSAAGPTVRANEGRSARKRDPPIA